MSEKTHLFFKKILFAAKTWMKKNVVKNGTDFKCVCAKDMFDVNIAVLIKDIIEGMFLIKQWVKAMCKYHDSSNRGILCREYH